MICWPRTEWEAAPVNSNLVGPLWLAEWLPNITQSRLNEVAPKPLKNAYSLGRGDSKTEEGIANGAKAVPDRAILSLEN